MTCSIIGSLGEIKVSRTSRVHSMFVWDHLKEQLLPPEVINSFRSEYFWSEVVTTLIESLSS